MQTFMLGTAFLLICFLGLGIGLLFGRNKSIKGSCGGIASGNSEENCNVCGGDPNKCENKEDTQKRHYSKLHKALHNT